MKEQAKEQLSFYTDKKQKPYSQNCPIMKVPDSFPKPPRWATWYLEKLCAPHLLEEMQDNLEELYHTRYFTRTAKL